MRGCLIALLAAMPLQAFAASALLTAAESNNGAEAQRLLDSGAGRP